MTQGKRTKRLNSLLQEVISEVIHKDLRDPRLHPLISITEVDISNDLQHAKVFISVIGTEKEKEASIALLQSAAAFIAMTASKKVVMRYFPALIFKLDTSLEEHLRINQLIDKIHEEQATRHLKENDPPIS